MAGKTLKFIKQHVQESQGDILDACCGNGWFARDLSSAYPGKTVYGLDTNLMSLAQGIEEGNFKRAVPVFGNAYNLGKKNPDFQTASLNPKYDGIKDFRRVKLKRLKEPLENLGLLTTICPAFELSSYDINKKIGENARKSKQKESIEANGFIPIEVFSRAVANGGSLLYETEIANIHAGVYGGFTPRTITPADVEDILTKLKEEGENTGLRHVSHTRMDIASELTVGTYAVNLAVLFKKVD